MDVLSDRSQAEARESMVQFQIENRGVRNSSVLNAMRTVPRHRFVPRKYSSKSYEDSPLPIGQGQTISQPYIVARMSELLQLPEPTPQPGSEAPTKVLEIGTGCGYQTMILAQLATEVYSIEVLPDLARATAKLLAGLASVHIKCGDGFSGWPEAGPFDGILVAAAPPEIPPPLLTQLKVGGRLVIPVGREQQHLLVVERTVTGFQQQNILPVRFVPMVGEALA